MHNRERIPKYAPKNDITGRFEDASEFFSDAKKEDWAVPGHIDMDCVPGEAQARTDFIPSDEDMDEYCQELEDNKYGGYDDCGNFYYDEEDDHFDTSDDIYMERRYEQDEEMINDEERFNAAGHYRGRVGETFVCTQQQFNVWDMERYRERKLSSENTAPLTDEELSTLGDGTQVIFDRRLITDALKRQKARYDELPWNRQDGDRQHPSILRAQEKRIGRQIKYGEAA